jgi:hypothetical protein
MLCCRSKRAASVTPSSPSIVCSCCIMSDALNMLGLTSLVTPFETISQSVTIPRGLSFSIIMMLPILCSFILDATSSIVLCGGAEITGLFITSLTRTLVGMLASRCFLVGLFTTDLNREDAFNYFAQQDHFVSNSWANLSFYPILREPNWLSCFVR